ncbi:MAG TPA: hypothetical protein PK559_04750 [Ignavibacteriaceae bacterium]|nr:hypothetical protein [Ignavibacteriaceae bacterium]
MTANNRLLRIGLVLGITFEALLYLLFILSTIGEAIFKSASTALLITLVNFVVGNILLKYGLTKPDKVFLTVVFGGMVLRLFLVLISIIISIKLLKMSQDSFIFAIFTFYIFFLTLEIIDLAKREVKVLIK